MTNSTHGRRRSTVSTWKKSHASTVKACECRNCRHVVRLRCGADGILNRSKLDIMT
jgi:hypothetical protein